jgi:hypothetical protein
MLQISIVKKSLAYLIISIHVLESKLHVNINMGPLLAINYIMDTRQMCLSINVHQTYKEEKPLNKIKLRVLL